MSCLFPHSAFDTGYLTENGKADLIIMPHSAGDYLELSHAQHIKPISPSAPLVSIGGKTYLTDPVPIPCNNCVGCRLDEAKQWVVRLSVECSKYAPEERLFITLTYDDDHLPVTEDGEPVLNHDYKQFIKNIRNHYGYKKFRFFGCGEYGSTGHRPHFHIILLGPVPGLKPLGLNTFSCEPIDMAWSNKGITQVSLVEPGLIAYVCGYCMKKASDPFWYSYPVKPFRFMSDRPGIGFHAIDSIDLSCDPHVYGNFGSSRYYSVPQAFLRKMEDKPGYKDYKLHLKQSGKAAVFLRKCVYNVSGDNALSDLREIDLSVRLDNSRHENI